MYVELMNKDAVESGHNVLDLICQENEANQGRNLMAQTNDVVCKFKTVVSLLEGNKRFDHARMRRSKKLPADVPQKVFLETPHSYPQSSIKPLQLLPLGLLEKPLSEIDKESRNSTQIVQEMSYDNPSIDLTLSVKPPGQQLKPQTPSQQIMMVSASRSDRRENKLKFNSSTARTIVHGRGNPFNLSTMGNRSFVSSLNTDDTLACLTQNSFQLTGLCLPHSSDQNSRHLGRWCGIKGDNGQVKCANKAKCHCSKKRKKRVKRSIKVPATSNQPADGYLWRKYGQKPIKGSPHPRGYFKCSSIRGCPARKRIERCLEDPSMLTITYEDDHNHASFKPPSDVLLQT